LTIKSNLLGCSTWLLAGLLPRRYFVDLLGGAQKPTTRCHQASWTTTQQMVLRLGTTQPWCRNLWRHPALLFDVVGTDGGAQELSPSKPIPANTTALVQGPGRQHISLAMRLNKHTRDAL
jgi:hypothetical protein